MNTTNTSAITEPCENRKGILLVADLEMRDYFAAKAMQTMLASVYEYEDGGETHSARMRLMAVDAYVTADAMLTERAKPCS